jgi:hypothetical protein
MVKRPRPSASTVASAELTWANPSGSAASLGHQGCGITEEFGKRVVDLDDRAIGCGDEQPVLHGLDQSGTPRGFMVAHPGQVEVRTDPREQLG